MCGAYRPAKPTSFDDQMFKIGSIDYYAVDHTPSYLWESASRSISAALLVHLPTILEGRDPWNENETIRRAAIIDRGVIKETRDAAVPGTQDRLPA